MLYPDVPMPSSVSAPAIMDPMLEFQSDAGYSVRRAMTSRPRRRYTLEYLGKITQEMRYLRDFLMFHRLGVTPFQFRHPTAFDVVPATNTTPVWLQFYHGLITGQWVNIGSGPAGLIGQWQVTRIDAATIALNGSVASGAGQTVVVSHYLPNAIARFPDNTWPEPAKLIGPEVIVRLGGGTGHFSWAVQIEEIF